MKKAPISKKLNDSKANVKAIHVMAATSFADDGGISAFHSPRLICRIRPSYVRIKAVVVGPRGYKLGSELINSFCSDNTILIRFWKGIGIMRRNLFWLSDEQWERIEPHLPTDVRGVERADDRRVISGIVHVLKSGCRWCDCPPEYGPPTTIYNRFVRWARRGIWENLFRELAGNGRSTDTQMIDSTHVKAHRSAAGGKGGSRSRLLAARAEGATRRSMHSQMLKGASSPSC